MIRGTAATIQPRRVSTKIIMHAGSTNPLKPFFATMAFPFIAVFIYRNSAGWHFFTQDPLESTKHALAVNSSQIVSGFRLEPAPSDSLITVFFRSILDPRLFRKQQLNLKAQLPIRTELRLGYVAEYLKLCVEWQLRNRMTLQWKHFA